MYGCVYVCQFPLAAYYGKVARARMVKFSHKIRPVQPFVVLKFSSLLKTETMCVCMDVCMFVSSLWRRITEKWRELGW